MKTTLFFFFALILITSCKEEAEKFSHPELVLVAPNGDRLASNLAELKDWTKAVVQDKFGYNKEFEITNIEYFNVAKGFVAQINFKVDAVDSHYIIGNSQLDPSGSGRVDPCKKWQVSCSGTSCCTPTFDVNTSQSSCTCASGSNSGCSLTAECLDQQ